MDYNQSLRDRFKAQLDARRGYNPGNVRGANDVSSPIRSTSLPQVNIAMERNAARRRQPQSGYGANHPLDIAAHQQGVQDSRPNANAPIDPNGWGRAGGGPAATSFANHTPYAGHDGLANLYRQASGGAMDVHATGSFMHRALMERQIDHARASEGLRANGVQEGLGIDMPHAYNKPINPALPQGQGGGLLASGGTPGVVVPRVPAVEVPQVARRPDASFGVAADTAPSRATFLNGQAGLMSRGVTPELASRAGQANPPGANDFTSLPRKSAMPQINTALAHNAGDFGFQHPNATGPERPLVTFQKPTPPQVTVPSQPGQDLSKVPGFAYASKRQGMTPEEWEGLSDHMKAAWNAAADLAATTRGGDASASDYIADATRHDPEYQKSVQAATVGPEAQAMAYMAEALRNGTPMEEVARTVSMIRAAHKPLGSDPSLDLGTHAKARLMLGSLLPDYEKHFPRNAEDQMTPFDNLASMLEHGHTGVEDPNSELSRALLATHEFGRPAFEQASAGRPRSWWGSSSNPDQDARVANLAKRLLGKPADGAASPVVAVPPAPHVPAVQPSNTREQRFFKPWVYSLGSWWNRNMNFAE